MHRRPFIFSALSALTLSLLLPLTAKADVCPQAGSGVPSPFSSTPYDVPAGYKPGILGPATLPKASTVAQLLVGYNRFGHPGVSAAGFLAENYRQLGEDPQTHQPTGEYKYPPDNGFDPKNPGQPYTLQPGETVDRFGQPDGTFLANKRGTPFNQRALPPSNLNTYSGSPESNYHVYCVLKPLKIQKGGIAPAFGQDGGGEQYYLGNGRVQDLIAGGTLREIAP
jgi:hypothetical protein